MNDFVCMNKRKHGMFMETRGLWDVVVNQFRIILLVEFVLIRQSLSIETNTTKIVQ